MAEATTNVSDLGNQLGKMADQMERNEKAAKGIEFSFLKIASAVGAVDLLKEALVKGFKNSEAWLKVQKLFTEEKLAELGYTQKLVALEGAGLAVALSAGRELYLNERALNQNLIEANASWAHRTALLGETLVTQAQLGISFGEITKAAAALVSYGLDTESTFSDNVRLIAQMEQGLGVSVGASAQLASIVERQLKGSFTDVSHVVAQLVDDTALAGDEAVRLANAIAQAMGRLRPGLGAQGLPEVLKLVGRYEAALKEVGGAPGAFQQLITSLTRPEGIVGAGALAVAPEFIATAQGVEQVMDRFARFGNMMVGQAQGWDRQFRLMALAEIFGTTAEQANQMLIAIQRAKEQQVGAVTVQDRWREQMHATNMGITRLANSLAALMQGALLPVVKLIGFITNMTADFVEFVLQYRPVVYAVSAALLGGLVVLVASLWRLVRALVAVAVSATGATTALTRQAAAQLMLPGFGPTAGKGILRALFGGFMGPVAAGATVFTVAGITTIIGVLLAGLAVQHRIYALEKKTDEDNAARHRIIIQKSDQLALQTRQRIVAAAKSGKTEDMVELTETLVRQARARGGSVRDQIKWINEQTALAQLDAFRGAMGVGAFIPREEVTEKQLAHEEAARTLSSKMLEYNRQMAISLAKAQIQDAENANQLEEDRAKNRAWYQELWPGVKAIPWMFTQ
jgi:hypothetical protein